MSTLIELDKIQSNKKNIKPTVNKNNVLLFKSHDSLNKERRDRVIHEIKERAKQLQW